MCKHYDCQYYSPETSSCDYMLITGVPRPCPPTDDCAEYCTDPKAVKHMRANYTPRVVNKEAIRRMEAVYKPGMETKELSKLAKVSPREALFWTRKVHPESHVFEHSRSILGRVGSG